MKHLKRYWNERRTEGKGTLWLLVFTTAICALFITFDKVEDVFLLWVGITIGILGHAVVVVIAHHQKDKQ